MLRLGDAARCSVVHVVETLQLYNCNLVLGVVLLVRRSTIVSLFVDDTRRNDPKPSPAGPYFMSEGRAGRARSHKKSFLSPPKKKSVACSTVGIPSVVRVRGPLACFSLSESGDYITLHYIASRGSRASSRPASGPRPAGSSSSMATSRSSVSSAEAQGSSKRRLTSHVLRAERWFSPRGVGPISSVLISRVSPSNVSCVMRAFCTCSVGPSAWRACSMAYSLRSGPNWVFICAHAAGAAG